MRSEHGLDLAPQRLVVSALRRNERRAGVTLPRQRRVEDLDVVSVQLRPLEPQVADVAERDRGTVESGKRCPSTLRPAAVRNRSSGAGLLRTFPIRSRPRRAPTG